MIVHTTYECATCGRTSEKREDIQMCEISHIGLTQNEMTEWKELNGIMNRSGLEFHLNKNEITWVEYNTAIKKLSVFEKERGIASH